MVLEAIFIVLTIFLMIGLGMFLYHIGWLKDEHQTLLTTLVVKVALPCVIMDNLFRQYTRESLAENARGILAPAISLLLTWAAAAAAARLGRIPKGRRGVFCCMFIFSNTVFIGVPVALALFGEEAIPYTLLYYIANTVLFWSAGYTIMRRDAGLGGGFNWKKLLPVPLTAFFICMALILVGFYPPKFVMDAAGYVAKLVTPLSMFFIGIILMRMVKNRAFRWQRGYSLILVGRFLIAPAMLLITSRIVPMPDLMRNALLIQAAMPVMSQTPIVAGSVGADAEYAAGGIAVTTLGSLLFIPLYMALIPYL